MTTTKKMAIIWAEVLTNIIVVIVLQYISLSNHHILDVKTARCYMSVIARGGRGGQLQGSRLTPCAKTCEHTHTHKPVGQSPIKSAKGLQWPCWLLVSLVAKPAGVPSAEKVTGNPRNSCCMADSLSSLLLVVTTSQLCWSLLRCNWSRSFMWSLKGWGSQWLTLLSLSWPGKLSLAGSSLFAQSTGLWGMEWCKAKLKLLFLPFVCSYSQGFCSTVPLRFHKWTPEITQSFFIGRSLSNDWSLCGDVDLCGTVSYSIITASLLNIPVIMKIQSHRL